MASISTATCWVMPPATVTWATPSMRSRAGATVSSARICSWDRSSPKRAIMAVGIMSLRFILMITGSEASSGREARSNCSRSLVAAMSRSVPSS